MPDSRDAEGADEELPPTDYDTRAVEKKWQENWEKDHTYWFDWSSQKPVYSIDNPPRYANAALHLGHATSYTQIDFAARYKRLRGYNVFFPLCADVNGMPIEVATEKRYGVNRKNTPRQKLIELCSAFAAENIAEMTRQFRILGHSMDPSLYYQTDSVVYRRITQLTFLVMLAKGLVYKKEFPVTWCPHCGTALASADVEYQERKTKLNFVKFGREDGKTEVIATTRPELLCACQALDILSPLKTSAPLQKVHEMVRVSVPRMEKDRVLSEDINLVARLTERPAFLEQLEAVLGHPL